MAWHDRISQVEMRRWEKEERRNPPLTFGAIWPAQNGAHCRPIIREYLPSRPTFQYLKKVLRREGPSKLEVTQEDNHSSGVAMVVTKFLVRSGWPLGGSAFLRKSGINIFRNIFFYSQMRCIATVHTALSIFQRPPALLKESEYFDGGRMWCGRGKLKVAPPNSKTPQWKVIGQGQWKNLLLTKRSSSTKIPWLYNSSTFNLWHAM